MNWYKLAQSENQYLYHGTSEGAFRKIREEGLVTNGGFIYLSEDIQYAKTYSERKGNHIAGLRILRISKTPDMLRDKRINIPGDYLTNRNMREQFAPARELKRAGLTLAPSATKTHPLVIY